MNQGLECKIEKYETQKKTQEKNTMTLGYSKSS
jgi:hypothetical protein